MGRARTARVRPASSPSLPGPCWPGAATRITGDGKQTRDFAYVGDIARANLLALESEATGIFNVGTGVPTDINVVYSALADITGYTRAPEYVPRPVGEVLATYLDSSKAARVLGWQPTVSLHAGLEATVAWLKTTQTAR